MSAPEEPAPKAKPLVRRTCLYLLGILILAVAGTFFVQAPVRTWRLNRSVGTLEGLAQPGTASVLDPAGVHRHAFSNGEWVVGVAHDSHSFLGGGVLVVRDSRGATRAFRGHVCGSGAFKRTCRVLELRGEGEAPPDLDALYRHLGEEFTERELER